MEVEPHSFVAPVIATVPIVVVFVVVDVVVEVALIVTTFKSLPFLSPITSSGECITGSSSPSSSPKDLFSMFSGFEGVHWATLYSLPGDPSSMDRLITSLNFSSTKNESISCPGSSSLKYREWRHYLELIVTIFVTFVLNSRDGLTK